MSGDNLQEALASALDAGYVGTTYHDPDGGASKVAWQSREFEEIEILYPAEEEETADFIERLYQQIRQVLQDQWGLERSPLKFIILRNWWEPTIRITPLLIRGLLLVLFPLVWRQLRQGWRVAAVWTDFRGSRFTLGVKSLALVRTEPPVLIAARWSSPQMIRRAPEEIVADVVQSCVLRAFAAPHKLPEWLVRGMAAMSYDRVVGSRASPPDLAAILASAPPLGEQTPIQINVTTVQNLSQQAKDKVMAPFEVAYWVTRYIEEQRPDLLRSLFQAGCSGEDFERRIGEVLQIPVATFRVEIVSRAATHFARSSGDATDAALDKGAGGMRPASSRTEQTSVSSKVTTIDPLALPRWAAPLIGAIIGAVAGSQIPWKQKNALAWEGIVIGAILGLVGGIVVWLLDPSATQAERGNGTEDRDEYPGEGTLVGRVVSVFSLLFCCVPVVGLTLGIMAVLMNLGVRGWPRKVGWLGIILSAVMTVLFFIALVIEGKK